MGKITGYEKREQLPEKVLLLYEAVLGLVCSGEDISGIKVSDITNRAGIGKGTAYDYFDSKEEIIVCALLYSMMGIIEKVGAKLATCVGFKAQVEGLFTIIESNIVERSCFIRFINLMTNSSIYTQTLRQITKDGARCEEIPMQMLHQMIEDAMERGEVRKDLPLDYLTYELIAKLITYIAVLSEESQITMTPAQMKPYILNSIWDEFCV